MEVTSAIKIKKIFVFLVDLGKEIEFLESAKHLSQVLAERKIHLVYGEGSLRLMGVLIAVFLGGS
jgi:predicted Rossmann-fold nucleotide-binding protein